VLLDVQKRFGEVNGGFLASAVTLSLFLSLFPLMLVGLAILGYLGSDANFAADVVENLGLRGEAADAVTSALETARENRAASSVVGLAGLLWAGLGVVSSLQTAIDNVWQVKGRGVKDKAVGLLWLVGMALLVSASFTLTGLLNVLPGWVAPLAFLVSAAVHTVAFLWTFKVLAHLDVGWRLLQPGAIAGGIGFQVLTTLGAVYVPRAVASSSGLYGSIGVVFAILAWLFFFGRLIVYASVLNVVTYERERGTVTAEIQVPNLPDVVPLETTRSGVVDEAVTVPNGHT
jgi:membrane protein